MTSRPSLTASTDEGNVGRINLACILNGMFVWTVWRQATVRLTERENKDVYSTFGIEALGAMPSITFGHAHVGGDRWPEVVLVDAGIDTE